MSNSIADTARANLLAALSLTPPQQLSNVDLMAKLRNQPGQTTWTFTSASDADNYWLYLESLRP